MAMVHDCACRAAGDAALLQWGSCGNGLIAHVLTVPGLDNSGPEHWQSLWEASPRVRRADLGDWSDPDPDAWAAALDAAIAKAPKPLLLAAHSLGCLAVARWADRASGAASDAVLGAMLVAPADAEAPGCDPRVSRFGPVPRTSLPFPSTVIASSDDRHAAIDRSRDMAAGWGSEFVDYGACGHLNAASSLGIWPEGMALLSHLQTRAVRRRFDSLEFDQKEEAAQ